MLATDASWPEKDDAVVSTDEDVSWQTGTTSTWVGGARRVVCVYQEDNESWPLWRSKKRNLATSCTQQRPFVRLPITDLRKGINVGRDMACGASSSLKKMVVALDQMSL